MTKSQGKLCFESFDPSLGREELLAMLARVLKAKDLRLNIEGDAEIHIHIHNDQSRSSVVTGSARDAATVTLASERANSDGVQVAHGTNNTFQGDTVSAGLIRESLHRVSNLPSQSELREYLEELGTLARVACKSIAEIDGRTLAKSLKAFVSEVMSETPRTGALEANASDLMAASKKHAPLASDLSRTVQAIVELSQTVA